MYIIMFLVLDCAPFRDVLLIDERPRIEPWHRQIAEIIATVMHNHGQPTPLYERMARRPVPRGIAGWIRARLASRRYGSVSRLGMPSSDEPGSHGYHEPTR
jgi:hypothetical protein